MKEFIYCQHDIPKEQWRYGFRDSASVGCGWVATYNALLMLGYRAEPERLIRMFERMLPLVHGNTGTTAFAPAVCFRRWGFPVEIVISREKYDAAAKEADACILFYHWKKRWKFGGHFVALRHTPEGFIGYNTYKNSKGPDHYGQDLAGWIQKRGWFGTVLICIRRRPGGLDDNAELGMI